ncbi:hypothetical protein DFH09DRAFT_1292857 [Mycena vulgaris]|nr:hypothetical protein DFH09DRAFT_1292857 [Mycena vulgaris]
MALNFRRISSGILSYRLGYSPQRPYPWRWTTPTVLCSFILLAAFLVALNVPLSAYEIVQEFTYRPNDTLPSLPFSNMIPEMLQHPTGGFTPQILTVGDTLNLNNSIFNWSITAAVFHEHNSRPVSSFSYYNNPFPNGCDVTEMTITLSRHTYIDVNSTYWPPQYTVNVTCHIPTLFTLTWNGEVSGGGNPAEYDLDSFTSGLSLRPLSPALEEPDRFVITVLPCCDCGEVTAAPSAELPTQAPCRLRPARFVRVNSYFEYPNSAEYLNGGRIGTEPSNGLRLFSGDDTLSEALNTMFLNTFQSLYHLVRLELGLILENQIYASPEMYNRSIAPVYVPGINPFGEGNGALATTSDADVMAKWQDNVRLFNESDRVPVMLYLRSVPRLKPLGSAITSVFVSTFAMLSVLWTIFSLIAGALAGSQADIAEDPKHVPSISQMSRISDDRKSALEEADWDGSEAIFAPENEDKASLHTLSERLSLTGENNNIRMSIAIAEIQLTLARMGLALRKHGILADSDGNEKKWVELEHDLTADSTSRDLRPPESHPLLVQRPTRRAALDSAV